MKGADACAPATIADVVMVMVVNVNVGVDMDEDMDSSKSRLDINDERAVESGAVTSLSITGRAPHALLNSGTISV
jgi:hypothetical protein